MRPFAAFRVVPNSRGSRFDARLWFARGLRSKGGISMKGQRGWAFLFLCSSISAFAQHEHHDMSAHAHGGSNEMMRGMYGAYPMARESSGTAWQPDATPMDGLHLM